MRVTFPSVDLLESSTWEVARTALADDLRAAQAAINTTWDVAHNVDGTQRAAAFGTALGQASGNLSEQPTGLTVVNDGFLYFVKDYGHLVRWDGAAGVWKFAPGDVGNGFFRPFGIAPQEVGWGLCDGSGYTYLVVGGATLTTATFTTPNLTGNPRTYLASSAGYTGAIDAAVAPGATTGSAGSHNHGGGTSTDGSHNHGGATGASSAGVRIATVTPGSSTVQTAGAGFVAAAGTAVGAVDDGVQTHPISSDGSHAHTINSDGSHTHSVSVDATGKTASLGMVIYFRR